MFSKKLQPKFEYKQIQPTQRPVFIEKEEGSYKVFFLVGERMRTRRVYMTEVVTKKKMWYDFPEDSPKYTNRCGGRIWEEYKVEAQKEWGHASAAFKDIMAELFGIETSLTVQMGNLEVVQVNDLIAEAVSLSTFDMCLD